MIVPKIKLESGTGLVAESSLFGKVLLSTNGASDALLTTVRRLGRKVNLQIEVPGCSVDDAISLLNEGASEIVVPLDRADEFLKAIEPDRLRVTVDLAREEWPKLGSLGTHWLFAIGELQDELLNALSGWTGIGNVQVKSEVSLSPRQMANLHQVEIDGVIELPTVDMHKFLAESIAFMLKSDRPDGLWPTLVTDELGTALGLAYSNRESLQHALGTRTGVYWSRSRNELWVKGKSSGATQELLSVALDCDSDCLRFCVRQQPPGFCHRETHACFGRERNIQAVISRLNERILGQDKQSFTRTLANDAAMLQTKLLEEARELGEATSPDDIAWEAADVMYFALVKLVNAGVRLDDVYGELARRMNRIVRRPNKLEQEQA